MDRFEKVMTVFAAGLLVITGFLVYSGVQKENAELKFKYEAALNGAPVVVCVK